MYECDADKATVMLVLSGNGEAYGDIVHRYKDIVFNVIYAIVKNYHTAEDLTQDTFIDGYIKLKSLGEPYNVGAWLVKMAKNKCYNHLTRSPVKFENELHDFISDPRTSTPENFLIEQEERHTLRKTIQLLPDLHKTVTELYYFDNLSQNEIAELLKIPIGTVSRRLHDARLKLKKELDNMDNNDKITISKDFEKQVAEKVKAIQNYYSLHNHSYDGFDNEFKETVELIDQLPESQEKHGAYADVYLVASWHDKVHQDRALQEAELAEKAQVMSSVTINKYLNGNYDEFIIQADEILPKMKKMPNNPDNANGIGELLFWRGSRKFIQGWENADIEKLNEAKTSFVEAEKNLKKINSYYSNAIAGIKAVEIETNEMDNHIKATYGITGEGYRYENGKMIFAQQPGFSQSNSNINRFNSIFYYVSYNFDRTFFDENLEIGGKIIETKGEYTKSAGSTHTLISKNEKVTVLAGTFDDCMHIKLHGLFFGRIFDTDVYYAKGVGLVKAEFVEGDKVENYELSEYKINDGNAGSEYFPFAVGNIWRYINKNLPSIYWQTTEYELINIHPDDKGVYVNLSAVRYVRLKKIDKFSDDCDSDGYITLADTLVTGAPKIEYFDDAIKYLKFALRKNSSARASIFAVNALEFMEKCRDYKSKNYRFLPSRINSSIINKKEDKLEYTEWGKYDVAPHRMGTRHEESKIFGMKPFRYLQELTGTLYSEKWIAGYSEQIKHNDGDINLTVEDGGTITVKAGTFENCLKVTVSLESADNLDANNKKDYFFKGFRYTHCGTKIFWYAPNVGIVKHDCIWGDSSTSDWPQISVCELTEYKSVATDGEYMPIYIGNRWIYNEMTLESGYKAQVKYDIVSGMEEEFFMIYEQEYVYLGTEEEYEEFKKSLNK